MKVSQKITDAALEWARAGVNLGGIASALEAEGLKSPAKGGKWGAAVVKAILVEAGVDVTNITTGWAPKATEEDETNWPLHHHETPGEDL